MVAPIVGALIGGGVGLIGSALQKRANKRSRRRQRKAIQQSDRIAEQRVAQITGEGSLFSLANNFLKGTFENAADSPLANDFAKRIRAQQGVRGTFGAGRLAAQQEALGTSIFAQNLRQQLLPQAMQFAFAPEQFRQSIAGFEAPRLIAAATGGQLAGVGPGNLGGNPLSGFLQGAAGGFQLGQGFDQNQIAAAELDELRQIRQQRFTGSGLSGPAITQSQGSILQGLLGTAAIA